jgi:protein gp37
MAENSAIEWTDHTLNFWWGCFKVSPGCTHCYAETFSKRVGRNIWGPPQTTERWRTKGPWQDCLKWDKQARRDGVRRKVFCQSMSDFFEDHPQVTPWRWTALRILEGFTNLDIQLLTKRPENIMRMVPGSWLKNWPPHIWIGTSVESQEWADKRIPELLRIPAAVRFLSVEPLLGPVNLLKYLLSGAHKWRQDINWVIVGGESGHDARPFYLGWARDLISQCRAAGVPVFMKQLGSNQAGEGYDPADWPKTAFFGRFTDDKKGGNPEEWPKELQVREFPQPQLEAGQMELMI